MFSNEFDRYFNPHVKKFFVGVFAFDKLPKTIKPGFFYICNTADSSSSGEHWFAVYRRSTDVVEYFNSLGTSDNEITSFKEFVKYRGVKKLKFNNTRLQSETSENCGEHCIYFIYQRLYNQDIGFNELLNIIYDINPIDNDKRVTLFTTELMEELHQT